MKKNKEYVNISGIHIIGGGLAGTEAAWQIAQLGVPSFLYEMRPNQMTNAHNTDKLAELVCSNSFRSDDANHSAIGLLHEEMRLLNSLILCCADSNQVPAGTALAVDRDKFSSDVQKAIEAEPLITVKRNEITSVNPKPNELIIIASGPLTSSGLSKSIVNFTGEEHLAFFDAIAPIIYKDSIDFKKAWFQSRYDKGESADYINCPLNQEQYEEFVQDLLNGEKTPFHQWEENTPYFEGCLPIEVMAERGLRTLSFGPMKPVGLSNPHDKNYKPAAILQLRQDNALGTIYNMVGCQTKLTYNEQKRIFRKIPGLEKAEFARLGGIHRNTFINGPKLLTSTLELKSKPNIQFAGQITGCEGYVESASIGLLAGKFAAFKALGLDFDLPPKETALGSILRHITGGANAAVYQPMNINFGLFPPLDCVHREKSDKTLKPLKGKERRLAFTERSRPKMKEWLASMTSPNPT